MNNRAYTVVSENLLASFPGKKALRERALITTNERMHKPPNARLTREYKRRTL
jgi:hypothetical protein